MFCKTHPMNQCCKPACVMNFCLPLFLDIPYPYPAKTTRLFCLYQ